VAENEISQWPLSLNRTNTFLANDDWLFCSKGSLQSVALKERERAKVKAVLQATVTASIMEKG